MYPVTPRFQKAIKEGGHRLTVCDVYYAGQRIETDLPVTEGTITVDRNSRNRRSGTIVIADPKLMPRLLASDKLSPFATELVVRTGIVYPDKAQELIPQGRFVVTEVVGALDTGLIPTATLQDRSERVFEVSIEQEIIFSGVDVFSSISSLIGAGSDQWAPLQIHPALINRTIADAQFDTGTDRWQLISDLALTIQAECFFDREGNPVLRPIAYVTPQTKATDSVWALEGGSEGVMTIGGKTFARADVYNAVHVVGSAPDKPEKVEGQPEPPDPPVPFATVYNMDLNSLTRYGGPFGKKLLRLSESTIKDTAGCYNLALTSLRKAGSLGVSVEFTAISNPALDVGDIITVNWPDGSSEFAVVDSLALTLLDGLMTGVTVGLVYV